MLGVGLVDLVVDAEEVVLLDGTVPVVPRLAMQRAVSEGVDGFEVAPVADVEEFGARSAVFACPGGLAEDCGVELVSVLQSFTRERQKRPLPWEMERYVQPLSAAPSLNSTDMRLK
jgi:hypothetical protein